MPMPVHADDHGDRDMLVIAHRGASGERPEHTLAAYERAIDQGADYIEVDLVVTRDFRLVARHDTEIGETTDVGQRPEFADRRKTVELEGQRITGWFAEDFTLDELRTLRVKERLPGLRPANARFDGLYPIPTFEEIVTLLRAKEAETGRSIGIYPELKHPTWLLQETGIDTVDLLVTALRKADLDGAEAMVFVQVFEVGPLRRLDRMIDAPLVMLIGTDGGPYDEPGMRWADMLSPAGLSDIAAYADAIGPHMGHVLSPDGTAGAVVADAHAAGLQVHPWTLRKENAFLPPPLRSTGGEAEAGDVAGLVALLRAAEVDGVFTDDPALVVEALGAAR